MWPKPPPSQFRFKKGNPSGGSQRNPYFKVGPYHDTAVRCAEASGLSKERCDEVIKLVFNTMARELTTGNRVMIEGFGVFHPVRTQTGGRPNFMPAKPLLDALNGERSVPTPSPPPQQEAQEKEAITPATLPQFDASAILPVHEISEEDQKLINEFVTWKQGAATMATPAMIFEDGGMDKRTPSRILSDDTASMARRSLQSFTRRCPVPLRMVGLTGETGEELKAFEKADLRKEILLYARDYEARMIKRMGAEKLQKFASRARDRAKSRVPIFFRTMGWTWFHSIGQQFFDWMEVTNRRPKGTNPFTGLRKFSPLQRGTGDVLIELKWYKQLLAYPRLSPKEKAILFLMQNGLRRIEVTRIKIDDLNLKERKLFIIGKGNKARIVPLLPWTIQAIDAWLNERRNTVSPYLFPSTMHKNRAISRSSIKDLVRNVASRAFPLPEQRHIVKHFHTHGLRHYFATVASARGVDTKALGKAMGISSLHVLLGYINVDEQRVQREFRKISRKKPW